MRTEKIRNILVFMATVVAILIILSVMNIKRPMRISQVHEALKQLNELDQALQAPKIDWTAVQKMYRKPLTSLVKETKRYIQKADLYGKIEESIAEGKKGSVDDVQSIIIRRTLLRICVYHAEALLISKDEQETSLTMAEREERMKAFMAPIIEFARESVQHGGLAYEDALQKRWAAWQKNQTPEATQEFLDGVDGLFADAVLQRLAQWRLLSLTEKEQRRKAVVLQADMRQLFHIFYPRLYDRIRQKAWEALTEFTNDPSQMNADAVEKVIRENYETQFNKVRVPQ
jgi:hypothetical protein